MKGIFTEEEKQHPSKNSTEFEVEFIYAHRQFPDRKRGRDDTKSGLQYRVKMDGLRQEVRPLDIRVAHELYRFD
jgi:hypothetical protein